MAADKKLTNLTAAATVAATDIMWVVVDPSTTPLSRKCTITVLATALESAMDAMTFSNTGLHILGTGGTYDIIVAPIETGAALSADRTLSLDLNNSGRTISLSGNLVLGGTLTTGATLTTVGAFATAGAFTTVGAFGITITATNTTSVTLPTSGTLYGTATGSITSAQLATSVSDETGSGVLVFGTSPVFTTDITTPAIKTAAGALTITPASGSGVSLVLATTGDFIVNTNMLVVDTSEGKVGIGTTTPTYKLQVESATANFRITSTTGTNVVYQDLANTGGQFLIGREGSTGAQLIPGAAPYDGVLNVTNAYSLQLGASNAIGITILASSNVGVGVTAPLEKLQVDDAISISNDGEGSTGRLTLRSLREVVTLSGATKDTTFNIPSGAMLMGVQMCVNTAVTDSAGDDTWSSAFITGSTTAISTASAAAKQTKVNKLIVPEITSNTTNIRFTPNGGNFTAGVIEVVAYYWALTSMADGA